MKAPSHYPPRTSAIHGPNPNECAKPGTWHRIVLSDLVRCCSAFAHTSNAPTTLDPRCSALGCEPEASHNGQAIDAGRHAAVFHRSHHSNGHPVGGTKIRHAEVPVSAAGTALRSDYLWPSQACSRRKLLVPGPPAPPQLTPACTGITRTCASRAHSTKEGGRSRALMS